MRWVLPLLVLGACASPPAQKPLTADWGAGHSTRSGKYVITLQTEPAPPVLGELFVMRAEVRDLEGGPVEKAKVKLNARMPQHNHGMETDPVDDPGDCDALGDCRHVGGVYRTRGFKFHMGGDWTVTAEVEGPAGSDGTSFIYPMPQ